MTPFSPLQSVERELIANARALRSLARDLVGPGHADDLVQETALRALRTVPPAQPTGLGGWLATILRRLAHNDRRDRLRRRAREQAAPAPAAAPATLDEVARREALRRCTMALFALPEPYQATLLRRYFEGLSPAEIAARDDTSIATVKSRLQRGLQRLRAALDEGARRRGERPRHWRAALLGATGLCRVPPGCPAQQGPAAGGGPTGALTPILGAWIMAHTGKLAVGAALAAGAFLWWQSGGGPAAPPPATAGSPAQPAVPAHASTAPRPDPAPPREALADPAATGIDLGHPHEFALRCRVVDADGLPVRGARVALAPAGCALNLWEEATGADGYVDLRFCARTPSQRIALGLGERGAGLRELQLEAGVEREVWLLGEPGGRDRLTGILAQELVLAIEQGREGAAARRPARIRLVHSDPNGSHRLQARRGLHPAALFGDLIFRGGEQAPAEGRVTAHVEFSSITFGRLQAYGSLQPVDDPDRPPRGVVTGRVFGEDGEPVAGATVAWGTAVDRPRSRTRTDENGAFRFEDVLAQEVELRAGGGEDGLCRMRLLVAAAGETAAVLHLRRDSTIRGTAADPGGRPLGGHRVEYRALDGHWVDATRVRDDGSFLLANLPPGPATLLLLHPERDLPVAVLPTVLPDTGPVTFDLGSAPADGRLVLRPALPDGVAATTIEARVWQADTGRGARMKAGEDGTMELGDLRAGSYRVVLGGAQVGWIDLGQHFLDGRSVHDLGRVLLRQPGTLRLPGERGSRLLELYQRRPDGDVRAEELKADMDLLHLPPGPWLALWRDGEGPVQGREFAVAAGVETVLELPPLPR